MKYSNSYLLYPRNKALERALENSLSQLGDDWVEAATPNTKVAVADNFLFTRGNFEQHRFNSNILERVREALEGSLTAPPPNISRDQQPLAEDE